MLADDIAAVLPELRAEAEARMTDSCEIKRPTGTGSDPVTFLPITTYDPVYAGKCRVKKSLWQQATAQSVDASVTVQSMQVHIPVDAPEPRPGDVVFMADDTETRMLRGEMFRVEGSGIGSQTTAQAVPVSIMPGSGV